MIICCIPFAFWQMPPTLLKEFSISIVSVLLFVSNIFFWQRSGYFDTTAEEKPLLHTWSLAVEEQFYFIFPIILLLLWRFHKSKLIMILIFISGISFLFSIWGSKNIPAANFYLITGRAWELLAGSISALILFRIKLIPRPFLSLLGFVFLIVPVFLYDKHTPFPSHFSLIPVLGTVLILLFNS